VRKVGMFVMATAMVAAGCWVEQGYDASRTGFDPFEKVLTAAVVAGLQRAWVVDGADAGVPATTPIAVGSTVYTTAGITATAHDGATGALRWRTPAMASDVPGGLGPLTAIGDEVAAPAGAPVGGIAYFDQATGAARNEFAFHQFASGSIAHGAGGTAVVRGSYGSGGPFAVTLLYPGGTALLSLSSSGTPAISSPTFVGGHVLIAVGGSVMAWTIGTCTPAPAPAPPTFCAPDWTTALPTSAASTPAGVGADRAAVSSPEGDIAVLDVATGSVLVRMSAGAGGLTPPAVGHDVLFVGAGNGLLYAFPAAGCGAPSCGPLWSADTGTGAAVSHQPAGGADVIYVGTANGRVVAFPLAGCGAPSCAPRWTGVVDDVAGARVNGPIVSGGVLYAATSTGRLAAFRLPG
jgi:outer membrane protein assembly factor BamB